MDDGIWFDKELLTLRCQALVLTIPDLSKSEDLEFTLILILKF